MKEIISKLEAPDSINTDEIIQDFLLYYRKHDRHQYHEITVYILEKFVNPEDGETVSIILSNLEDVMNAVRDKCICEANDDMNSCLRDRPPAFRCEFSEETDECAEYKWLYRKLNKLHDHISLESSRIGDLRKHNSELKKLLKEANQKETDLKRNFDEISEEISNIAKQADETEIKLGNAQKEYITILGIFAAIVLAFTGGIAFSTSVLENIDAISPYRLAAAVIGLAFVMINIVYILVWFIQQINKSKDEEIKYPCFMRVINGLLVIAVIVTVACWCCLGRKADPAPNSQSQYSVSVEFKNKPETKPE